MNEIEDDTPARDELEVFTLLELRATFAAAGKPSAGMWTPITLAEIRRIAALSPAA